MSKMFDDETLERLRKKIALEDYVSGFVDLSPGKGRLFGLCPFHKEDTASFMVDISRQRFYCFGCKCGGDIFTFVMKTDGISFKAAVLKVAEMVGETAEPKQQSETLSILRKLSADKSEEEFRHNVLDKSVYEKYEDYVDLDWVNEGVPEDMFKRYEIKLDRKHNRIIYPVYDKYGNFINIKGRTKYECFKVLKIPKYINYYKVGCMDYLQGLHLTKEAIKARNEIIIFEGLKSCMKAEGFGYHNVVSAETSGLTLEQVELIISLHCNVVIAFDKDKRLADYLSNELKLLSKFVNLYYIDDRCNLLGDKAEKNSPADKGKEVWEILYHKKKELKCYQ